MIAGRAGGDQPFSTCLTDGFHVMADSVFGLGTHAGDDERIATAPFYPTHRDEVHANMTENTHERLWYAEYGGIKGGDAADEIN